MISALFGQAFTDAELKDYFPHKYRCGKLPNQALFWIVLFIIKPHFGKDIIKQAIERRNGLPNGTVDRR